ncbi:hypothetical protein DL764_010400 [Monosporascus ibericus]|uniref:Uncharacterized protein n=1 Tax=Monosporascus ibericus TaxID=155417 RepID=A0A4Q4SUE3_9PEZI|nr:hypothetical protein DL764_010400 [Monosporascus ibericus]
MAHSTRSLLLQRPQLRKRRTSHGEGGFSSSTKPPSSKEDFDRMADRCHWQGNATGFADRKANISTFGPRYSQLWMAVWNVRVDLAAAAPPSGSSSSTKDSMEKARHSELVERL